MHARLRTTLFVTCAIAAAGCGESFVTTGSGGTGGTSTGAGAAESTVPTTTDGGGGTAGGSGGGGTGGIPCDATDADGDGFSQCTLDCDDTNELAHPEALEICGDGIDEDCDGADNSDDKCNAYSVYVSAKYGTVGGAGTIDDPVATIEEGLDHAKALGGAIAVLVSAGTYTADLTVSGTISLVGGYDPEDWTVRDPALFETVIKDAKPDGLKLIGVAEQMIVDGFTIYGPALMDGVDPSIAVNVDGGSPILSNLEIVAGAIGAGTGHSIGVRFVALAAEGGKPRLLDSTVTAGPAAAGAAYGVLVDADSVVLALARDKITALKGTDSVALLVEQAAAVTAYKNTLQSGTATGAFNADSSSLGAWIKRGSLVFDSNRVNADQVNNAPKCFTPDVWCGGVRVSTGTATITNNQIIGSLSARSASLALLEVDTSLAEVVVNSNLLLAAGASDVDTLSAAVLLGSPKVDATVTTVGRFRNNLFFGGYAAYNYGFFELRTLGETVDPAALDHNLFHFPVNAPNAGILYGDWNGLDPTDLLLPDELPGDGANLFEDPLLVQSHLSADSPCRNAGTDLDAPKNDLDQDERPQEELFDIGSDEFTQ